MTPFRALAYGIEAGAMAHEGEPSLLHHGTEPTVLPFTHVVGHAEAEVKAVDEKPRPHPGPGAGYRKRPLRGSPPALRARSRRRGRGGRPSPRHAAPWGDRLRGRPTHRHAPRRAQEPLGLARRYGAGGLVGGCGRAWHGPLPSPSGNSRSRRDEQGRPCRDGPRPLGGRARHDRGSATARRGDRIRSARSNFQSQCSAVLRLVVAGNLIACRSG